MSSKKHSNHRHSAGKSATYQPKPPTNATLDIGIVLGNLGTQCVLDVKGEEVRALTKGHRLTVGDEVQVLQKGSDLLVHSVLPRRTLLTRSSPNGRREPKLIVANVDVIVVVLALLNPPLHHRLIDRYLTAINQGGADAIVAITKVDLDTTGEALTTARTQLEPYTKLGVEVVELSSLTGSGVERLLTLITGKRSAFVGQSGVGKSTLLNAIILDAEAKTGNISQASNRGQHTTTTSRLYRSEDGLEIIDTPGIREFGLDFSNDVEVIDGFPEFAEFAHDCRFSDCQHLREPACGVQEAVRNGSLSRARYVSYRKLMGESGEDDRETFFCANCGLEISKDVEGTEHRNHCPQCLHSLHLDHVPGDRAAACGGIMDPIAVWVRNGGEWAIVHRCRTCGRLASNRIASDDNDGLLMSFAVRPLANPPFPLEQMRFGQ